MAADALPVPNKRPGFFARLLVPVALTAAERRELAAKKVEAENRRRLEALLRAECSEVSMQISEILARRGVCYKTSQRGKDVVKKVRFFKPGFFFSEEALYLPVDLRARARPYGVGIGQLQDPDILDDLSASIGRKVEAISGFKEGFVYRVWRLEGVGGLPRHVVYDEMLSLRPATIGPWGFPVGVGEGGKHIWKNMIHTQSLLITGTTGAGKSTELHAILTTLIANNSKRELQLALVDWKRVELRRYRDLPQVARYMTMVPKASDDDAYLPVRKKGKRSIVFQPIMEEKEQVAFATEAVGTRRLFDWVVREMERRMGLLEAGSFSDIGDYNRHHRANPLPQIIAVIEEWAQVKLDEDVGKHCTAQLIRIASLGRAMGISLIMCTQYPSQVIDMRIRAVLNTVLSFTVPNLNASVAILGNKDAFRLSAQPGRAIYQCGADNFPVQAPLITPEKSKEIVATVMAGNTYAVPLITEHDVTPTEVLEWAVDKNNGELAIQKLADQFSPRGFTFHHARRFVEGMYGKTVTVFEQEYIVRRGGPGYPTRLVLREQPPAIDPPTAS